MSPDPGLLNPAAWKIEPRREIPRSLLYATPLLAVVLTVIAGFFIFLFMGYDPLLSLYHFFISPLLTLYGLSELMVKAGPLIMIGVGLAVGFRANVWNIGAEGQLTLGAITGGVVALAFWNETGWWILPLMCGAGILGGMAYAAIPAFLRTRFNVNEILTSLMLTYVATLFLSTLVYGPLKDPMGFNFPQSRMFSDSGLLPILLEGTRLHLGSGLAIAIAVAGWVLMTYTIVGFQVRVLGQAPAAARYAGFSGKRLVWFCLLLSGGLAGLAGTFEVAGPIGQLIPVISPGYGFTAIIVAFLGRLHPLGIILSGLVMALSYIGGENAQVVVGLPQAVTGVFQGLLLFFLLASDFLVRYRIRRRAIQAAPDGQTQAAEGAS
ncbi:ABC transporter permease [Pelagibius litoralis]|uniref:ABC transporter permease n=1 Tax=Pelagibius litoralis TaxID=374515 RepID=A0A967EWW3_9PROT|nr:ABC transporter permease [Pelagibius litoralis]NIA68688.1 ABC transporter permease [Pelagibius litoralis]